MNLQVEQAVRIKSGVRAWEQNDSYDVPSTYMFGRCLHIARVLNSSQVSCRTDSNQFDNIHVSHLEPWVHGAKWDSITNSWQDPAPVCPGDTNRDGDCGRTYCPFCRKTAQQPIIAEGSQTANLPFNADKIVREDRLFKIYLQLIATRSEDDSFAALLQSAEEYLDRFELHIEKQVQSHAK